MTLGHALSPRSECERTELRDYLKFRFSAPPNACKCGNCQLIPLTELKRFIDERDALLKALEAARKWLVINDDPRCQSDLEALEAALSSSKGGA